MASLNLFATALVRHASDPLYRATSPRGSSVCPWRNDTILPAEGEGYKSYASATLYGSACHSGGGEFVISDSRAALAQLKTFRIGNCTLAPEIQPAPIT